MSEFDQTVFIINGDEIIETTIREAEGRFRFIVETSAPHGLGPRYHIRGTELWTWGTGGSAPRLVEKFNTEDEVQDALEVTFVWDFWNCPRIEAYKAREEAEEALRGRSAA